MKTKQLKKKCISGITSLAFLISFNISPVPFAWASAPAPQDAVEPAAPVTGELDAPPDEPEPAVNVALIPLAPSIGEEENALSSVEISEEDSAPQAADALVQDEMRWEYKVKNIQRVIPENTYASFEEAILITSNDTSGATSTNVRILSDTLTNINDDKPFKKDWEYHTVSYSYQRQDRWGISAPITKTATYVQYPDGRWGLSEDWTNANASYPAFHQKGIDSLRAENPGAEDIRMTEFGWPWYDRADGTFKSEMIFEVCAGGVCEKRYVTGTDQYGTDAQGWPARVYSLNFHGELPADATPVLNLNTTVDAADPVPGNDHLSLAALLKQAIDLNSEFLKHQSPSSSVQIENVTERSTPDGKIYDVEFVRTFIMGGDMMMQEYYVAQVSSEELEGVTPTPQPTEAPDTKQLPVVNEVGFAVCAGMTYEMPVGPTGGISCANSLDEWGMTTWLNNLTESGFKYYGSDTQNPLYLGPSAPYNPFAPFANILTSENNAYYRSVRPDHLRDSWWIPDDPSVNYHTIIILNPNEAQRNQAASYRQYGNTDAERNINPNDIQWVIYRNDNPTQIFNMTFGFSPLNVNIGTETPGGELSPQPKEPLTDVIENPTPTPSSEPKQPDPLPEPTESPKTAEKSVCYSYGDLSSGVAGVVDCPGPSPDNFCTATGANSESDCSARRQRIVEVFAYNGVSDINDINPEHITGMITIDNREYYREHFGVEDLSYQPGQDFAYLSGNLIWVTEGTESPVSTQSPEPKESPTVIINEPTPVIPVVDLITDPDYYNGRDTHKVVPAGVTSSDYTWEIMMNPDDPAATLNRWGTIMAKSTMEGIFTTRNAQGQLSISFYNYGDYLVPVNVVPGQWMHIAVVNDGSTGTAIYYINGAEVGRGSSWTPLSAGDNIHFGLNDQNPEAFAGYLAGVKTHGGIFTPEEIALKSKKGLEAAGSKTPTPVPTPTPTSTPEPKQPEIEVPPSSYVTEICDLPLVSRGEEPCSSQDPLSSPIDELIVPVDEPLSTAMVLEGYDLDPSLPMDPANPLMYSTLDVSDMTGANTSDEYTSQGDNDLSDLNNASTDVTGDGPVGSSSHMVVEGFTPPVHGIIDPATGLLIPAMYSAAESDPAVEASDSENEKNPENISTKTEATTPFEGKLIATLLARDGYKGIPGQGEYWGARVLNKVNADSTQTILFNHPDLTQMDPVGLSSGGEFAGYKDYPEEYLGVVYPNREQVLWVKDPNELAMLVENGLITEGTSVFKVIRRGACTDGPAGCYTDVDYYVSTEAGIPDSDETKQSSEDESSVVSLEIMAPDALVAKEETRVPDEPLQDDGHVEIDPSLTTHPFVDDQELWEKYYETQKDSEIQDSITSEPVFPESEPAIDDQAIYRVDPITGDWAEESVLTENVDNGTTPGAETGSGSNMVLEGYPLDPSQPAPDEPFMYTALETDPAETESLVKDEEDLETMLEETDTETDLLEDNLPSVSDGMSAGLVARGVDAHEAEAMTAQLMEPADPNAANFFGDGRIIRPALDGGLRNVTRESLESVRVRRELPVRNLRAAREMTREGLRRGFFGDGTAVEEDASSEEPAEEELIRIDDALGSFDNFSTWEGILAKVEAALDVVKEMGIAGGPLSLPVMFNNSREAAEAIHFAAKNFAFEVGLALTNVMGVIAGIFFTTWKEHSTAPSSAGTSFVEGLRNAEQAVFLHSHPGKNEAGHSNIDTGTLEGFPKATSIVASAGGDFDVVGEGVADNTTDLDVVTRWLDAELWGTTRVSNTPLVSAESEVNPDDVNKGFLSNNEMNLVPSDPLVAEAPPAPVLFGDGEIRASRAPLVQNLRSRQAPPERSLRNIPLSVERPVRRAANSPEEVASDVSVDSQPVNALRLPDPEGLSPADMRGVRSEAVLENRGGTADVNSFNNAASNDARIELVNSFDPQTLGRMLRSLDPSAIAELLLDPARLDPEILAVLQEWQNQNSRAGRIAREGDRGEENRLRLLRERTAAERAARQSERRSLRSPRPESVPIARAPRDPGDGGRG